MQARRPLARSATRLLSQDRRSERTTHRCSRHRTQARDDRLAHADQGDGLYLGSPRLMARKLRSAELRARMPANHAKRGAAYDYNIPSKRAEERQRVELAEADYARFAMNWRTRLKSKPVENPG